MYVPPLEIHWPGPPENYPHRQVCSELLCHGLHFAGGGPWKFHCVDYFSRWWFQVSHEKRAPGCLGYVRDEMLPSCVYVGITTNHYNQVVVSNIIFKKDYTPED